MQLAVRGGQVLPWPQGRAALSPPGSRWERAEGTVRAERSVALGVRIPCGHDSVSAFGARTGKGALLVQSWSALGVSALGWLLGVFPRPRLHAQPVHLQLHPPARPPPPSRRHLLSSPVHSFRPGPVSAVLPVCRAGAWELLLLVLVLSPWSPGDLAPERCPQPRGVGTLARESTLRCVLELPLRARYNLRGLEEHPKSGFVEEGSHSLGYAPRTPICTPKAIVLLGYDGEDGGSCRALWLWTSSCLSGAGICFNGASSRNLGGTVVS